MLHLFRQVQLSDTFSWDLTIPYEALACCECSKNCAEKCLCIIGFRNVAGRSCVGLDFYAYRCDYTKYGYQ